MSGVLHGLMRAPCQVVNQVRLGQCNHDSRGSEHWVILDNQTLYVD